MRLKKIALTSIDDSEGEKKVHLKLSRRLRTDGEESKRRCFQSQKLLKSSSNTFKPKKVTRYSGQVASLDEFVAKETVLEEALDWINIFGSK